MKLLIVTYRSAPSWENGMEHCETAMSIDGCYCTGAGSTSEGQGQGRGQGQGQ